VQEPLPDLRALTLETTGKSIRRVGRFIRLALVGAARCLPRAGAPADTAVYLGSGRGDLELTLGILIPLFRQGQLPKPLSFVHTVSNAACFYVAQTLGLRSRSNFVCNRYFAFESALQLAALDLRLGTVPSALVGSVDVATAPLGEHRRRLQLPPAAPVGEGSHWLWLGPPDPARPRLGELLAARHFGDAAALCDWLGRQELSAERCRLVLGQFARLFLDDRERLRIGKASGLERDDDSGPPRAYYDSHSGAAIGCFLSGVPNGTELLHVNADPSGRLSVMRVRR
jgi:hypothetical protein